jgi:hypothetical protein
VVVAIAAAAVALQLLRNLKQIIGTAGTGVQSFGTQGRIKCVIVAIRDGSQLRQADRRRFVAVDMRAAAVALQLLRDLKQIIGSAGAGVQSVGTQGRIKCVMIVGRDGRQLCQAGRRRFVTVGMSVSRGGVATAAVHTALLRDLGKLVGTARGGDQTFSTKQRFFCGVELRVDTLRRFFFAMIVVAAAVALQLLRNLKQIIGSAGAGVQSVGTQGRIKCVVIVGRDGRQLCQAGRRRFVAVGVGVVRATVLTTLLRDVGKLLGTAAIGDEVVAAEQRI